MHLKEWSTLGEIQESGHVRKSYCRKFIREHLLMRFPHFSLLSPKWMQCKPERLPKVFQKSLLSLGNERQVRLPCLETVLLKAISTGWGFLCDCGVHMGETDEPHKFGKGIKQLDWTCSQRLRQYSMQVLHAVVQDVLTCQKCSWRETIEISAAAPLEIFIKPEKSSAALSPPINSSAFRHSGTTPTLNHPN